MLTAPCGVAVSLMPLHPQGVFIKCSKHKVRAQLCRRAGCVRQRDAQRKTEHCRHCSVCRSHPGNMTRTASNLRKMSCITCCRQFAQMSLMPLLRCCLILYFALMSLMPMCSNISARAEQQRLSPFAFCSPFCISH